MQNFYNRFIRPFSKESEQAEREVVLNWLLLGTIGLAGVAFIDTIIGFVILRDMHLAAFELRSLSILLIMGIVWILYLAARYRRQEGPVAILLVSVILAGAFGMVLHWGLLLPTAIGLFCLAVVMAGILINARGSLYVAAVAAILLAGLQYGKAVGYLHPDLTWMRHGSTSGDVIGFSALFFIIALVSWLSNRQTELSLKRAQRSERALQRQKALLEIKVAKRTQELEVAQLEKMQHLYRFAELGRLSTALFHDLANHLAHVSLDIEGLKKKDQSGIMHRIQDNIGYIDTVVQRVRHQLQGKSIIEVFNVTDEVKEVVQIASLNARNARVEVAVQSDLKQPLLLKGDVTRFRQVFLNLVSNAIESYGSKSTGERKVIIHLYRERTDLFAAVQDHGSGIPPAMLDNLFKPFHTTKDDGVGIGLFIAKQIVENDFGGTIEVISNKEQGTVFLVKLPKAHYAPATSA